MNDGIRRGAAQMVMFPAMLPLPPSCIPVADAAGGPPTVVGAGPGMYADTVFAVTVVGDHAGEPATANGEAVA